MEGDEIWQAHSRGWIRIQIKTCVSQALVHQQYQIRPRLPRRQSNKSSTSSGVMGSHGEVRSTMF